MLWIYTCTDVRVCRYKLFVPTYQNIWNTESVQLDMHCTSSAISQPHQVPHSIVLWLSVCSPDSAAIYNMLWLSATRNETRIWLHIFHPICVYVELLEHFIILYFYCITVIVRKMKMCYLSIITNLAMKLFYKASSHEDGWEEETERYAFLTSTVHENFRSVRLKQRVQWTGLLYWRDCSLRGPHCESDGGVNMSFCMT